MNEAVFVVDEQDVDAGADRRNVAACLAGVGGFRIANGSDHGGGLQFGFGFFFFRV
ncbi:hypothetical protein D9M70_503390 [compost metagenome]